MFSSRNDLSVRTRILLPAIVSIASTLLFASTAFAGVAGSVAPDYPNPVTAGQTGLPAKLTIANSSTASNAADSVAVSNISHTPSCGSSANTTCTGTDVDTGVFAVHNGTGEAGTACAGVTFTAGAPDASGKVVFTPSSPIVLGPSSGPVAAAQCIIDFTVDVLKVPIKDANAAAGTQTDQLGFAQLQDQSTLNIGSGAGSSETTVNVAAPAIATTPSAGGAIGASVHDSVTVTGGSTPTGNVTFQLFGAGDTTCSAAAIFTSTSPLSAGAAVSGNFTPTAAGTYHWMAGYSGDANNAAATSSCASETVVMTKASPTIATTPSVGGPIGTVLNDTATLSGGSSPTGGVTFNLYAPADTTCDLTPVYTQTVLVAPYGTNPGFTSTASGTYHWTATYAGDANNNAVSSGCQDEPVTTNKSAPTITTTPSAGGPVGTVLNDTATLSGGSSPTGSITFNLYAPSDASCAAAPVYTNTATTAPYATTPGFTSNAAGVWHWTASYVGDANNSAATSSCASEAVTTSAAAPTIATTLSAGTVAPSTAVHDSSALTGATATAGGTVMYAVYTDSACTLGAVSAGTKTVTNGAVPNSDPVTLTTPGTYYWQAAYSGDANNGAATSTCGSEVETVGKFAPSIATTLSASTIATSTPVHDTSTLSGASSDAGGTVTYSVFTNATCTAGMQSAGVKTVTSGTVPNSDPISFQVAGTYYWQAAYSGDAKNSAAMSTCAREVLTVTAPTPPPSACPVDWKPVGTGWMDFGPIVDLNQGGRLLSPNNPCPLKLPLRFSPGPVKPQS